MPSTGKSYTHLTWCNSQVTFIQDGMQAIHIAAAYSHAELLTLLIDHFGVDPQEKKAGVRTQITVVGETSHLINVVSL